jgi:hypothetical protein
MTCCCHSLLLVPGTEVNAVYPGAGRIVNPSVPLKPAMAGIHTGPGSPQYPGLSSGMIWPDPVTPALTRSMALVGVAS